MKPRKLALIAAAGLGLWLVSGKIRNHSNLEQGVQENSQIIEIRETGTKIARDIEEVEDLLQINPNESYEIFGVDNSAIKVIVKRKDSIDFYCFENTDKEEGYDTMYHYQIPVENVEEVEYQEVVCNQV